MSRLTTFGQWLHLRRKALDLTQEELANRVKCSASAIRKIEADERRPSRQIANLLAESLEISFPDRMTFVKAARGEPGELAELGDRSERWIDWLVSSHPIKSLFAINRHNLPISNLPVPPNPMFDRKQELEKINHVIESPQCRLLSLVGRGGVGKTRLAAEVALNQRDYFPDGVFFSPLCTISSVDEIYPTIARSINLPLVGSDNSGSQILNYLAEKQMLFVLDNFEHLISGAVIISDIIQYAPAVKIIVTSTERLNLEGEWVFELHGLPVPPEDQQIGLESNSAVNLFIQNASRTDIGFSPKAEDYAAIAVICRLVDGLPLGIELAAGWVRSLNCVEIASEIETTGDIRSLSGRDAPERHRSLGAILDYSWRLLSNDEQEILSKLSIFRDGFRREEAELITGVSLQELAILADKSLLFRNENGVYRIYESIRRYALDHLDERAQKYIRAKLKGTHFNAIIAETTRHERFHE